MIVSCGMMIMGRVGGRVCLRPHEFGRACFGLRIRLIRMIHIMVGSEVRTPYEVRSGVQY